jgi:DNA-3-methyladenine glycosylase II
MDWNEFTLYPTKPYSILPHLRYFSLPSKPQPCIVKNNEFWRLIPIGDDFYPFHAIINEELGEIKVKYQGPEVEMRRVAQHIFAVDVDYNEFMDSLENYPSILKIARKYRGLRPTRNLNLYEALIKVVLQQRISLKFALRITAKIIERYGIRDVVDSKIYFSMPSPRILININPQELQSVGITNMKARALIEIAEYSTKFPSLEEIEEAPEMYVEKLTGIYGVGRWSAELAIATVIHDYRIGPAGDLNVRKGFFKFLGVDEESEIREYVKRFGKWRSLIMYLLALEHENIK